MPRVPVLLALVLILSASAPASALANDGPSRGRAFLLSLLVPGTGHWYANGGDWDGAASLFLAADVGLWAALVGTSMRYSRLSADYQTLAALRAGADVSGKDRTFFLSLSAFRSSDAFLDAQLRARAWDQLDYVSDPAYQWNWASEEDFLRFRELREDAESMRRRRPVLAAILVGNRLVSGILALRAAGRADADVAVSFDPVPLAPDRPALTVHARF